MHHNTPVSTATHPSAQALTATSGTFTDDLTVDTDTLKVDASEDTVCINTTDTNFDAGADDYVTKPFQMEEVLARLRALIRRSAGHATSHIK